MTEKLPMFLMPCLHLLRTASHPCSEQLIFVSVYSGNNGRKMSKKPIRPLIFSFTPAIVCTNTPSVQLIGIRTSAMRTGNDSAANFDRPQVFHQTRSGNHTE